MVSKKDFFWFWKDSLRESILNQFYYEHIELRKALEIIEEARKYIEENRLYNYEYDEEELFEIITDKKAKAELLEILDKVKEVVWN